MSMPTPQTIVTTPTRKTFKPEIPSKTVLDILATSGENVPDMFTREAGNPQLAAAGPSALPWMDCPVIDFSLLSSTSPSPSLAEEELKKLHSALVSWGSFQLVNHGMTGSFLDELQEVSKGFFVLPIEERTKYLREAKDPEGYGNDTVLSDKVPHNWNDRLYLTVFPKDQRKLQFWPHTPSSFREMLDEFATKVQGVNDVLLHAMAQCLGLEETSFVQEFGENMSISARINYYPQCPFPDLVRASRTHSDASALTLLLQDKEVDGLQVLKDDMWFKVPIIPHALFVNVGDQMEIMSNGIYKSAVHRVVANSARERMSIVMFCSPNVDKEIGPLKNLVTRDRPALYKTIKRYGEIFFQHHPYGERPITSVKI